MQLSPCVVDAWLRNALRFRKCSKKSQRRRFFFFFSLLFLQLYKFSRILERRRIDNYETTADVRAFLEMSSLPFEIYPEQSIYRDIRRKRRISNFSDSDQWKYKVLHKRPRSIDNLSKVLCSIDDDRLYSGYII